MKPSRVAAVFSGIVLSAVPLARGGAVLNNLLVFNGGTGLQPASGVTFDVRGNLYLELGTTNGYLAALYPPSFQTGLTFGNFGFNGGAEDPFDGLTTDAGGDLYGASLFGGANGRGAIFKVPGPSANDSVSTVVASFNGSNGSQPLGPLVADASGVLYGVTSDGGSSNNGTLFAASSSGVSVLANFNSSNGLGPASGLVIDNAGNLFGVTGGGNVNTHGTVYEFVKSTQTFTPLVAFNGSDGSMPMAGLTMDYNGNLFGTTSNGGANGDGTIFELSGPNHATLTTLFNFNSSSGSAPEASLSIDAAGNLFGTTLTGGANGVGTIFELTGSNYQTLNVLANFNSSTGHSVAGVTPDNSGNLFGTLQGPNNYGSLFELTGSGFIVDPRQVTVLSTYHFTASSGTGITVTTAAGLTISYNATAIVDPAMLHTNRQLLQVSGPGLAIAGSIGYWTGLLDLGNNDMDISNASLATVTDQVRSGYAGGTWTGFGGITSSAAAADTTHLTALGVIQNNQSGVALFTAAHPFDTYTPGAADILVKFTYYGDTNLDGKVDGSDYTRIDNGLLNHLTGWFNGDFNYDGVVNGSDYTLIDNAFNSQGAALTSITANVTAQIASGSSSAVPEPSTLMLLACGGMTLRRRARRISKATPFSPA